VRLVTSKAPLDPPLPQPLGGAAQDGGSNGGKGKGKGKGKGGFNGNLNGSVNGQGTASASVQPGGLVLVATGAATAVAKALVLVTEQLSYFRNELKGQVFKRVGLLKGFRFSCLSRLPPILNYFSPFCFPSFFFNTPPGAFAH
jgi:hypothetical protein